MDLDCNRLQQVCTHQPNLNSSFTPSGNYALQYIIYTRTRIPTATVAVPTTKNKMASTVLLFGPGPKLPDTARLWNAKDFVAVDDKVRQGSSHSNMTIVDKDDDKHGGVRRGDIEFSGFLDTITLGGAGFASQAYRNNFLTVVNQKHFSGLQISVRRPKHNPDNVKDKPVPGGGKKEVSTYVLLIKTQPVRRRPDGRIESSIVWQCPFTLPCSSQGTLNNINSDLSNRHLLVYDLKWSDFRATYRGRPVDSKESGPFQPEKTHEWSIMARSNFGDQSGPFSLYIHSLAAIHKSKPNTNLQEHEKRAMSEPKWLAEEVEAKLPLHRNSLAEYYGFALFIFATVLYLVWIIWALIPDTVLYKLGIEWYPNREWAFLLPCWTLTMVITIYISFISFNLLKTPKLDDLFTIIDSHSNIYPIQVTDLQHPLLLSNQEEGKESFEFLNTNNVYDISPGYVSRQMYLL